MEDSLRDTSPRNMAHSRVGDHQVANNGADSAANALTQPANGGLSFP